MKVTGKPSFVCTLSVTDIRTPMVI